MVCGPHATSFVIDTAQPATLLGVHFKPGGALPFLPVPAGELANRHVALGDLWGAAAAAFCDQLAEARTAAAAFQLVEQALLARVARSPHLHPAVAFALAAFRQGQQAPSIAAVSAQVGLSARRFGALFRDQVGLPPRRFCRVQRFQAVLAQVQQARQVHWADLALACGYYDQAHFAHDFRAFAGLTPRDYLARQTGQRNHIALDD